MKLFYITTLLACTTVVASQNVLIDTSNTSDLISITDSTSWAKSFNDFKTAIYKWDKNKIKSFIDFPLANDHHQIWLLINEGQSKGADKLGDSQKPFTEKDFDSYSKKLFPKTFRNVLLKVNTSLLMKNAEYETTSFRLDKSTTYKMYASLDRGKHTLLLSLAFHRVLKNAKGEVEDNEEYGTVYSFNLLPSGHIKFIRVALTA